MVWAFVGVVLGARGTGEPLLAIGAAAGLVVVVVAAVWWRHDALRQQRPGPRPRRRTEG